MKGRNKNGQNKKVKKRDDFNFFPIVIDPNDEGNNFNVIPITVSNPSDKGKDIKPCPIAMIDPNAEVESRVDYIAIKEEVETFASSSFAPKPKKLGEKRKRLKELKSIPLEERNLTDFSEIHDLQKIVKRADKNLNSKKNAAACLADLEEKFKKLDAERIKLEKEIAAIQANNRSLRLEKTLLRNIVAQHPMFGMDQQNPTLFSHSQPGVLTEAEVTSHYRLPNPGGSHDKG